MDTEFRCFKSKEIEDVSTWSILIILCTHPKVLSSAFKNSKAYICSKQLSINLVGEREWFSLYNFIEIVRIRTTRLL